MIDRAQAQAGRAHRATESLHSMVYFVPEASEQFVGLGLRPGSMPYFASRSAAMGAVAPAVTAATFYNFNPDMIARHIPRAWTLASPEQILETRLTVVDLALRRLLGDAVGSAEVAELAELTREGTCALQPEGRALFAAHAALAWPDEPHLVLWHAATLLREYRGDGHVTTLLNHGLSGIEALVSHVATGRGFPAAEARQIRGWSEEQWEATVDGLRVRGLMTAAGLTAEGVALRERIEDDTDRLDTAAWRLLGELRTDRVIELGKALSRALVTAGAFLPIKVLKR